MRIMVVDDEEDIVDLVSLNLQREGHQVIPAGTGEEALELLKTNRPDLIVLDLMLPGMQGLEVCRYIRGSPEYSGMPILILSAKGTEVDRILGLEMGADDYITKPFSVRELTLRVRLALQRGKGVHKKNGHEPTFSYKELFIDFNKYEVTVKGRKINLSPIEAKLLFFLTKNRGRVYTRDQLLDQVWGNEVFVTPRNVDVYISRLRKLIEQDPQKPTYIVTVTSVGYKFDDSSP
ncbi:MAG: response regulator transcription factor [Syntrophorhabdales bacterium]